MGISCTMTIGWFCVAGFFGSNTIDFNNFGIGVETSIAHKSIRHDANSPIADWKASYTVGDVVQHADGSKLPRKCVGENCISYSASCDEAALRCTYFFVHNTSPLTLRLEASSAPALELARQSLALMPDQMHPEDNLPFADFAKN